MRSDRAPFSTGFIAEDVFNLAEWDITCSVKLVDQAIPIKIKGQALQAIVIR